MSTPQILALYVLPAIIFVILKRRAFVWNTENVLLIVLGCLLWPWVLLLEWRNQHV